MTRRDIEQINEWIKAGAKEKDGVRLFLKLHSRTRLGRLVRLCAEANGGLAVRTLLKEARIEETRIVVLNPHRAQPITLAAQTPDAPKFRDMFPFLNDPNTPTELKILAADKITAYRKSILAHRRLTDCTTIEDCYLTAKEAVENYLENDLITREFRHYMDTGKVMGKHRIFDTMKRLNVLRASSAKDIFKRKKQIESCIAQMKYQIKKGDKPHKLTERETKLREYEHLLSEIERMIEGDFFLKC